MTVAVPDLPQFSSGEPLPTDLDGLVRRMDAQLASAYPVLLKNHLYLNGDQPLKYMAPAMVAEVGDRIAQLVINWAELGTSAYENRLDIGGFRYAGQDTILDGLTEVWQLNNLDEQSQQAHQDSIALGRSYGIVGSGDSPGDAPVVTVESPFQVTTLRDPRTRRTRAGLKRWQEDDGSQWGQLYQPHQTVTCTWDKGEWRETAADAHGLGYVPVVVLPNKPQLLLPDGRSEFHDIIPLADAANKMATDMMISGEFHAMPRRWAFGLKTEDFQDKNGRQRSTWSMIAGRLWSSEAKPTDVAVGTFPEADLKVFHETIKLLAQLVSQLLALPPHYMGFGTGGTPPSADAIRSSESQLVKRVERKQTYLGGAWEDLMRLVLRFQGAYTPEASRLETIWADPSTPTIAQRADAVVKLVQAKVLPVQMARMQLGWTAGELKMAAQMDDEATRRGFEVFGELGATPPSSENPSG